MKHIHEIGVYKSGDLRVEVVDLTNLQETVEANTAVFVGHTTVTSRIRGEDFSDSFQIIRAYLKQRARWRIVASQSTRMARPDARVGHPVRRIPA
jgi:hypothetical protein